MRQPGELNRRSLFVAGLTCLVTGWLLLQAPDVSAVPEQSRSIAVLPFVNISSQVENEYFSDGISEHLLNVLARLPLRVVARTSSFRFRGQNLDVSDIGEKLGVAHLLAGSVRKSGQRIRITAQLIHAPDGTHLWTEAWEHDLEEVLAVQTQIANKVAAALNVSPQDQAGRFTFGYTNSHAAYDLYLLGRHYFARRNPGDLPRALDFFSQAIELDPAFALAHVGQADALIFLQDSGIVGELSYAELLARAGPALERALALEPDLAEAHASLGVLISSGPDHAAALPHFSRAVTLMPNYAKAQLWFGQALMEQVQFQRAADAFLTAARLDPLTPEVMASRIMPLVVLGQREATDAALIELVKLAPDAPFGYTYKAFADYLHGDMLSAYDNVLRGVERQDVGLSRSIAGLTALALGDLQGAGRWLTGANRAVLLAADGQWDELVALDTRRLESTTFPAEVRVSLGQAEMQRGNLAQALSHFELPGVENGPARNALFPVEGTCFYSSLPAIDLAHLYRKLGREDEARALLEQIRIFLATLRENGAALPTIDYVEAGYYSVAGQPEVAMALLTRAVESGWRVPWLMRLDLNLNALRDLPAFAQLLDHISADMRQQREKLGL